MKTTAIAIFALSLAGPAMAGNCVDGAGHAVHCPSLESGELAVNGIGHPVFSGGTEQKLPEPIIGRGTGVKTLKMQSPEGKCFDYETGSETSTPCAAKPTTWHLLTKSQAGTVSLIKGLTEKECRKILESFVPTITCTGCMISVSPSDIVSAECFE